MLTKKEARDRNIGEQIIVATGCGFLAWAGVDWHLIAAAFCFATALRKHWDAG